MKTRPLTLHLPRCASMTDVLTCYTVLSPSCVFYDRRTILITEEHSISAFRMKQMEGTITINKGTVFQT
jgi:hypothetical protein